ncbi:AMP-binding enzyme, C-terminal domain [Dillenia turbinata]|uniref:Long-chain-fatty-acid--CoA ligase n=1 Tax=Dillenia turbinata TaxID=194707 RepID=A0AAN8UMK6_9MAGN
MESSAQRRLQSIQDHLLPTILDVDLNLRIHRNDTAGEFFQGHKYSVVLPEKLQTGKWNVYRSARYPLMLLHRYPDHPKIGTLHENFVQFVAEIFEHRHAVESFRDYKYLGTRIRVDGTIGEYKWMTYGEVDTARSAIGSGLMYYGLPKVRLPWCYLFTYRFYISVSMLPVDNVSGHDDACLLLIHLSLVQGSSIGLYFINRPEWVIVDHACSAYSFISVPLYDTLGPDAVRYIANHADIGAIFCVPETLNSLLMFLSEMPSVRLIVVIGGVDENLPSLPSSAGVKLISYAKLLGQGCSSLQPFLPPKPEDIATICYTSGTTGTPKGVVLTHGSMIASAAGMSLSIKFNTSDIYISYLPLAHIYERANQINGVYYGIAVGFYQGDNLKLMDDMAALRPTLFCSVPRLYNRIYAGIINAVKTSGALRERLFNAAYNSKKQAIMSGRNPSPMWDRLVFNKIKAKLGGRVRFMGSGASPLSPDVMDFLRVCFGCQVIEGYGMTETSCVISSMEEGDNLSGHVGSPNPACGPFSNEQIDQLLKLLKSNMPIEIKLVDVPEMNYTSDDQPYPRGEICVRGPIVFQGYYKDEVQTREVIDDDGWFHTGDIGLWWEGGRLKIIDRKKNIFKLAQGEYVAPEKIENVYAKCKFVAQCFVYGDSLNSCLVAVVAVDPDVLKDWAASEGVKYKNLAQLCNDPKVRAAVLADMDATGKDAQVAHLFPSEIIFSSLRLPKLRGFEFAKAVTLVLELFTVENGLLTPTFKIKRPQAKAYFAQAISNMYAELAASDPAPQKLQRGKEANART